LFEWTVFEDYSTLGWVRHRSSKDNEDCLLFLSFIFCLTSLFSTYYSRLVRIRHWPPKGESLDVAGAEFFFTGRMPFLTANLQCRSTDTYLALMLTLSPPGWQCDIQSVILRQHGLPHPLTDRQAGRR